MAEPEEGQGRRDVRQELVRLLLAKVQADPYPSVTMLDLLGEIVAPEERAALASVLMDKVARDTFPSLDMMSRLRDLA